MKLTYGNKLLLTFIFFGSVLTIVSLFTIYAINAKNIKINSTKKAQSKALEKINNLHNYYENIYDTLNAIEQSKTFKNYLNNNNNYGTIRELFLNIANTSKNIMQLRYIDNNGQELIRIDRKTHKDKPRFATKLQNKSQRYYFKEIMNTARNQIWHSQIDLNIENGEIQKPFQAVLRVATPVFTNNQRNGFLIINIFMNKFLEEMIASPTYNIYIIDANGYFKAHKEKNKMWTNYKKSSYNVKYLFPHDYEKILDNDEYFGKTLFAKNITINSLGKTKIIVEAKVHTIKQEIKEQVEELIFVMMGIILLSFPFAYLFAKTPSRLKEQVDKLNANLENKVHEKTFELQELNENLEKRVKKEVQENSRKDKLLFHQSKIASLGEMIRNIAHQWRQPLSTISTAASGIKLQKEMGILEDKDVNEAIDTIMRNSSYLSKTIDDFRNFFKTDKKIQHINVATSIKDDLNILKPTLKNNEIEVIINLDEEINIKTIKNELTQVHLNLISNAKDILTSKKNQTLKERLLFIELKRDGNWAQIKVIDNGGGIEDEIIENIFEPYFTTKHQNKGTGIGLFMCDEIICNHLEGSITAANTQFTYNNTKYKGAMFEIKLPIE